jgi:hypothetical protein
MLKDKVRVRGNARDEGAEQVQEAPQRGTEAQIAQGIRRSVSVTDSARKMERHPTLREQVHERQPKW